MNKMPGNPYVAMMDRAQAKLCDIAMSTLALAYEQRTANLIAAANLADDETADRLWVDHITPRLGMDET